MILIMRKSTLRASAKEQSRTRILEAAGRRMRTRGLDGAAVVPVMREAGLTHGAFYAHFDSKEDLASAAFTHSLTIGRPRWISPPRGESWAARLKDLATWYLSPKHRDDVPNSCGFAALGSEVAHGSAEFRATYERELRTSLAAICGQTDGEPLDDGRFDDAIALMAVCVGGLTLSRAVPDPALSERILRVALQVATQITDDTDRPEDK
jgi:TetR/AcrR family transcriptional repressor of nem operon